MMMSFWYWKVKVLPFWLDLVSLPSTWAAFTAACSVFFQSIPPSFFTCLSFFVLFAKSLGVERYFCRQVPCLQCVSTPQLTKPITSSSKVDLSSQPPAWATSRQRSLLVLPVTNKHRRSNPSLNERHADHDAAFASFCTSLLLFNNSSLICLTICSCPPYSSGTRKSVDNYSFPKRGPHKDLFHYCKLCEKKRLLITQAVVFNIPSCLQWWWFQHWLLTRRTLCVEILDLKSSKCISSG